MTAFTDFSRGLTAPWRGLKHVMTRTETWPWVILPVLLTTAALVLSFYGVWTRGPGVIVWLVPIPAMGGLIGALARGVWLLLYSLMLIMLFAVTFVVVQMLGTILAGPFHDRLSAQVELELGTMPEGHEGDWNTVLGDVSMGIAHSLLAMLMYAAIMVGLFFINVVPVLGELLYVILGTLTTALLLGRELFDYPLSRRRYSFAEKLDFLWRNRALAVGIGLAATLLLAVPIVNLLMMSVSVAGATLLFGEMEDL